MSNIEQEVPELKYALKMKELGFPQEGRDYWIIHKEYDDVTPFLHTKKDNEAYYDNKCWDVFLAPSPVQISGRLPQYMKDRGHMLTIVKNDNGKWWVAYPDASGRCNIKCWAEDENMGNALAKLFIHLRKEGLIKVEE